jgi:hypothetical protein
MRTRIASAIVIMIVPRATVVTGLFGRAMRGLSTFSTDSAVGAVGGGARGAIWWGITQALATMTGDAVQDR